MSVDEAVLLEDDVEVQAPEHAPVDELLDRIMSRIAPAKVENNKLKVLIYGEPGVGKTTLAATSPAPLLIDVERGSRAVLNVDNPVDVLEFRSIQQVEDTIAYLVSGNPAFDKYETIILDTLTEMQARLIDQQLRALGQGAPIYKADWGVYGENTQRLRMLISQFRDIPKNLIATAHVKSDKDDATGIEFVRPALTPGLAKVVNGMFDIVGLLKINNKGERVLRVQPNKRVLAKTRLRLPEEIINPTWYDLTK
jgi:phage nucleotide-binding protein